MGKGTDAASKVADAWNKFKEKIAQSGPVSGFDVAFDSVQKKLLNAAGGESGKIGKALNAYKEFANKYPKMQGAIYAGLIALAGISGAGLGGAALLAGLKTFDRLQKIWSDAESISSAIKALGVLSGLNNTENKEVKEVVIKRPFSPEMIADEVGEIAGSKK